MNARSWWMVAGLLGSAGCGDNAPQSEAGSLHLALTMSGHDGSGPVHALLSLSIAADGSATGTMAALGYQESPIAVSGHVKAGLLTLDPQEIGVTFSTTFEWNTFELHAGTGVLSDGAEGVADAKLGYQDGDSFGAIPYTATLTAGPDIEGEAAGLVQLDGPVYDTLLPYEAIWVALGEPADAAQAATVRVLANQVPLAGALDPIVVNDMVSLMAFTAPAFWPFGATLSVDPNGATDPSGNRLGTGATFKTDADPGPATANAGFEAGLTGWIIKGPQAQQIGAFNGIAPVEGEQQLLIGSGSVAAGYVDVPASASTLSLSIGMVAYEEDVIFSATPATVTLHGVAGDPLVIFDGDKAEKLGALCADCARPFRLRVPASRYSADVTPFRGQRVFVAVAVGKAQAYSTRALVLDDLRVE